MRRVIIAVANQKGGVAKTTTAVNLAAGLARKGQRVLLIDLDPQANATIATPVDMDAAATASIYDVLTGAAPISTVIQSAWKGVDIVPSSIGAAKLERSLSGPLDSYRLSEALEGLPGYDAVVLDCPPSLGAITANALYAATHVLVPVTPGTFALSGVDDFMETFQQVQRRPNPGLKLLGILVTRLDQRTVISRDSLAYLESEFGGDLLKARIRQNVRLDEAASFQQPIYEFDPGSTGAQDYEALTEEVLERVRNH